MRCSALLVLVVAGALALASPARADHARYGVVLVIGPETARELMERGGVAAIDLRPEGDYRAGRLPGARSLPLATLASRLDELPRDGVLVLYGDAATERVLGAYHLIRARHPGDVYVLEGGLDAWRRLGYRLER